MTKVKLLKFELNVPKWKDRRSVESFRSMRDEICLFCLNDMMICKLNGECYNIFEARCFSYHTMKIGLQTFTAFLPQTIAYIFEPFGDLSGVDNNTDKLDAA